MNKKKEREEKRVIHIIKIKCRVLEKKKRKRIVHDNYTNEMKILFRFTK